MSDLPHDARRIRAADIVGLTQSEIETIETLLPHLSYNDRSLSIYGRGWTDFARDDDCPTICYLGPRIADNYRALSSAFSKYFPNVDVHFAVKACYFPSVLRTLSSAGAGAEVMSEFELAIALECGFDPSRIVTNGVGRSASYAAASISSGAELHIADCAADVRQLRDNHVPGRAVSIGLRVNPPTSADKLYISGSSKLGASWRSGEFQSLLESVTTDPHLDVVGIHAHQVTHCSDLATFRACVSAIAEVCLRAAHDYGVVFRTIDIGGGFESRFLLERNGLDIGDFAAVAAEELNRVEHPFRLKVEPGRFIVSDAAIGFTGVRAEKVDSGRRYLISEIGSNVLIDLPELTYHPLPTSLPVEGSAWAEFQIGDSTCAPSMVCRDAALPDSQENRSLAILNTGAYTTVFSQLWAYQLPEYRFFDGEDVSTLFSKQQERQMVNSLYGYDLSL